MTEPAAGVPPAGGGGGTFTVWPGRPIPGGKGMPLAEGSAGDAPHRPRLRPGSSAIAQKVCSRRWPASRFAPRAPRGKIWDAEDSIVEHEAFPDVF